MEIKNDYPHYFQELRLSSSASYFTLVFMLTRFVVPYAQIFLIDHPYFQMFFIINVVLLQLAFQTSVNPYKVKFLNRIEVLNACCSLATLYCFMALSTGYLTKEGLEDLGYVIIVLILITILVQVGLIIKGAIQKMFFKYKTMYDDYQKKDEKMKRIINRRIITEAFPN